MVVKRINAVLINVLPQRAHALVKNSYLKWKRRNLKEISETEFRDILLKELHITRGSVVFVHSSLNNIKLGFSFLKILPILKEMVGEEGTLLFPAAHFLERAEEYLRKENIFDIAKSPSRMGLLSELARRDKHAVRSLHPTNSVVAIGKHARELTGNHHKDIFPCGIMSPYFRIVDYDGIIVGIGVSTDYLSFVHCVEDTKEYSFPIETRCKEIFRAQVRKSDGEIILVKTLAAHPRIRYRNIPLFMKKHIPGETAKDFNVKGANLFKANAKALYNQMGNLAAKKITIYTKKAFD